MKLEDIKKKLVIDEHALERELVNHPSLTYEVGMGLANAISQRDWAKQELDETKARVESEIRSDAAKIEEKVTEAGVKASVELDGDVRGANHAFLKLKLEAAQWQVLKEAFDQRSYALSKLVDLYLSNYYSNMEVKGSTDIKTIQADRIKKELRTRRVQV